MESRRPTVARQGPPAGYPPQPPNGPGTRRQPAPPALPGGRPTALGWAARGLVLVLVAVVSGLIWSAIKPHHPAAQTTQGPQTVYPFTPAGSAEVDAKAGDCKSIATGQVKELFSRTECQHLTRKLFTTTLPGGQKVLASVITVTMPNDSASAARLLSLSNAHDTGQIYALSHGQSQVGSLDDNVAYQTERNGNIVVIGDAGYYGRQKQPANDPTLSGISKDVMKLGWPQGAAPTN